MASQQYREERVLSGVSPGDAFDFVTDVANLVRIVDAVVEAHAEGEGVGMQIQSTSSMMGLKIKGTQQVEVHDRPSRYRYGGTDPFPAYFEWQFEEVPEGTRMILVADIEPKGLPGGGLVVGRFIKRQIKGMADQVVALVG